MRKFNAGSADAAVIGAGHAGIEAAMACARMGLRTVIFTINLDAIGNMPCNPAIGGTAKGHLVYEIDALGGVMPAAADAVTLQSRILNRGKGPAVQSKRVQADRAAYKNLMKHTLERQQNLYIVQGEAAEIETERGDDGKQRVTAVVTTLGARWEVGAAIICTGTYLRGRCIVGDVMTESGPDGMLAATQLTASLRSLGMTLMRFKTGTPPRVHRATIDFSKLESQSGDGHIIPYSTLTDESELNQRAQLTCHIAYTNARTHELIRENLDRSPLYGTPENGGRKIEGTGPRYCPSIEDKVVRFADKERHQLFVEPMGADTDEMY
ncbi:MAG: FAD-dependent oxidoreductase, partial [Eubacteriales bacterium]